ncbi:unnamed protein product [Parnassius mnemosyne]|uniref:C2H2-type domain-containing protein n=1 Tax=Parnassius mnemosyne TaxID=213953 RepID=A0AAV1KBU7_9NEOP
MLKICALCNVQSENILLGRHERGGHYAVYKYKLVIFNSKNDVSRKHFVSHNRPILLHSTVSCLWNGSFNVTKYIKY